MYNLFLCSDSLKLTDLISFASWLWSVFILCSTGQMEACDLDADGSDINATLEIQEFTAQSGLPCKRMVHLSSNLRGRLLSRRWVQTVRDGEV